MIILAQKRYPYSLQCVNMKLLFHLPLLPMLPICTLHNLGTVQHLFAHVQFCYCKILILNALNPLGTTLDSIYGYI